MKNVDHASRTREIWVDNVKVVACTLVVLGHFFQSVTTAAIVPATDLYNWFIQTIYYFHVPLFFICSGYLFQKYAKVDNWQSWRKNVLKKALALGVPYFTFSIVTWVLKRVFSDSVNTPIDGIVQVLFIYPTPPYWYLYCLFFIFCITPTFVSWKSAMYGLGIALIAKTIHIVSGGFSIYAVSIVAANEIWFVFGMCLCLIEPNRLASKKWRSVGIALGVAFLILSVLVYVQGISSGEIKFLLGIAACSSVILLMLYAFRTDTQSWLFGILAKYTLPIFLMHVIFAAPLRALLLKLGIRQPAIHIAAGLLISFLGPIAAGMIMQKYAFMDFFLYPGKYLRKKSRNKV